MNAVNTVNERTQMACYQRLAAFTPRSTSVNGLAGWSLVVTVQGEVTSVHGTVHGPLIGKCHQISQVRPGVHAVHAVHEGPAKDTNHDVS